MPSGNLRYRIGFYKRADANVGSPDYGSSGGYGLLPTLKVWGNIQPRLGGESILAGRLTGKNFVNITIRKSNETVAIDPDWIAKDESVSPILTDLILNFEGINGSNTFTDSTGRQSISVHGNPVISTSQFKFGGSSGLFDGSSWLVPELWQQNNLEYGTSDFTVEMFVFPDTIQDTLPLTGTFTIQLASGMPTQSVWLFSNFIGSFGDYVIQGNDVYLINDWNHIALTRKSGVFRLFLNGILQGSYVDKTNPMIFEAIGASDLTPGFGAFTGYIDSFRQVRGLALYTNNFTPPSAPPNVTDIKEQLQPTFNIRSVIDPQQGSYQHGMWIELLCEKGVAT